ncbi:MAG: elongation factor G [Ruminococcaceae bacterium]|nr:elongation factor G [Oscillospiraceae bacterium]
MRSADLRNVVLLGHGGTGKTSIAEAMLFNARLIDRMGRIADGNTALDYDAESVKRSASVSANVTPITWLARKINIIDTPGYFDFAGEMLSGLSAAASALIVVAGGVEVGAEKAWDLVIEKDIPRAIVINKMNDENAEFEKIYAKIRDKFGKSCVALQLPIRKDRALYGYVDTVTLKAKVFDKNGDVSDLDDIPDDLVAEAKMLHERISEAVAESEDALMEKYFGGEKFTQEEVIRGLKAAVRMGVCTPVLIASAYENLGIKELADNIIKYMPSPIDIGDTTAETPDGNIVNITKDQDAEPVAFVFKTVVDPFVGRLSYFKVFSGTVRSDSVLYNPEKDAEEKIGQLYNMRGKKQIPVTELVAGDIGAVAKLSVTVTNDTLCTKVNPVILPKIEFPAPQLARAISAKAKGDTDKIVQGLTKIADEDKTFKFEQNSVTSQLIITGVGEQHIDVIVSKLASRYAVSCELSDPKVAYRETIKKKVTAEATHKKQSGGSGQYGKVVIEFEPGYDDELEFAETVVGGSVPKQFFPSVEKGLQQSIEHGVLAGYPVVKLKATLLDGKYHPVDSKEVAFISAAKMAYKKAMPDAQPVLLEPVYSVNIYIPDKYMGDIIGDITKRRGRILGMNQMPRGIQEVNAEVPYAEMFSYATDLRSMTQARGYFNMEFVRYEEVPSNIAIKIIAEAKKDFVDDDED